MAGGTGIATVIELLRRGGGDLTSADASGEADQPELFGESASAPRPLQPKGKAGSRGGRPPGARNRTTREMALYLKSRGPAPLEVLQDMLTWDTGELTDYLQAIADRHEYRSSDGATSETRRKVLINPLDVLRFQAEIARELAQYTDQKQPKAVEVSGGGSQRALVLLGDMGQDGGDGGDLDGIGLPLAPVQEVQRYQGVIDGEVVQSDGAQSDARAKPLMDEDNSA